MREPFVGRVWHPQKQNREKRKVKAAKKERRGMLQRAVDREKGFGRKEWARKGGMGARRLGVQRLATGGRAFTDRDVEGPKKRERQKVAREKLKTGGCASI